MHLIRCLDITLAFWFCFVGLDTRPVMGSMETVNPTIPIVVTNLGVHTEMAITDIMAMVLDMVVLIPLVIRPLTAPLMVKPRLHTTIIITAIIIMAPDMVWATKHLTMVLELVMVMATKHLTTVMVTNMVLVVTKHLTMVAMGPHMVLVTKHLTMVMVMELMVTGLVMVVITPLAIRHHTVVTTVIITEVTNLII